MKRTLSFSILVALALTAVHRPAMAGKKVLYFTHEPGRWHKYTAQKKIFEQIGKKAGWEVTVMSGDHDGQIAKLRTPDFAKGYDAIVYNFCFAHSKDLEAQANLVAQTREHGVPAMLIHCAMHTYRAASFDDWRKFLGVTSRRHEHQSEYPVKKVIKNHPILKGMPDDWKTPKDELYVVDKLWPGAKALATSISERNKKEHAVIWTHQHGKARVFGTTYGHSDATFRDPVFLNYVSRGLLWAAERLDTKK